MTINWILPANIFSNTFSACIPAMRFNYSAPVGSLFSSGISSAIVPHPALQLINNLQKAPMPAATSWRPWQMISNGLSAVKSAAGATKRFFSNLGHDIVSCARKYLGYNERDNSYKLFTNGREEAWCADFVTHVVKESSQKSGKRLPAGFGSSSVDGLRQWGRNNNCYLETAHASNKSSLIKNNVKPGDIIIFKENGKSHTGIFKGFDSRGNILTIEGNTSDKVAERHYAINDNTISGFVQVA